MLWEVQPHPRAVLVPVPQRVAMHGGEHGGSHPELTVGLHAVTLPFARFPRQITTKPC